MSRSRAWSWRHDVARSDLGATTKHVLLTLSLHMTDAGENCYPPISELVAETSLSKTTVLDHIALAVEAGWLERGRHGFKGQQWKRGEYRPRWPEDAKGGQPPGPPSPGPGIAESEQDVAEGNGEGGQPPGPPSGAKAVNLPSEGGQPDETKVVKEVDQDKRVLSQEDSLSECDARARARDPHHTGFAAPPEWRDWFETEFEADGFDHELRQFLAWVREGGPKRRSHDWLASFQRFARNSTRAVPKRAAALAPSPGAADIPALRRPAVSFAAGQAWRAVQAALLADLGAPVFKSWIAALVLAGEADGAEVVIEAPTRFYAEWVERNHLAALEAAFGKPVKLRVGRGETA